MDWIISLFFRYLYEFYGFVQPSAGHLGILIDRGRAAYRLFEVAAEERLVGKVEQVAYLLHIVFAAFEQSLGFENDVVANPVAGVVSTDVEDHLRQVFGGDTQFVGIEAYASFGGAVLLEQGDELVENLFLARNILGVFLLDIGAHQLAEVVIEYLNVTVENFVGEYPFGLTYFFLHVVVKSEHLVHFTVGKP